MKKTQRMFSVLLSLILTVLLIIPIIREPYLLDDGFKSLINVSKQNFSEDSNLKNKKKKR